MANYGDASTLERLVNGTLGIGIKAASVGIQVWTYGLVQEFSHDLGLHTPEYFEAGFDMFGAVCVATAGTLGIIGGYKLLKHAVTGEKIGW